MHAHDALPAGPPTLLSGALLAHLNVKKMDDVIAWTYADTAWARFAALAPIVFAHYETDQVRGSIISLPLFALECSYHPVIYSIASLF
jgi:N-acetylglucosamine kinase-like BadF-type ATPase